MFADTEDWYCWNHIQSILSVVTEQIDLTRILFTDFQKQIEPCNLQKQALR